MRERGAEAGARVLHLHVRELDGKGSKRLSKFNELIAGVRKAVPDMIIQVGGSISFAPVEDGGEAKWLSDEDRHGLALLKPRPEQVTVAVNTSQMNMVGSCGSKPTVSSCSAVGGPSAGM